MIGDMKRAIRYTSGLLAIAFIVAAIYFGINKSWWIAVLFFLLFGGLEFALSAFDKSKEERD
jgi:general stress protein CsbA